MKCKISPQKRLWNRREALKGLAVGTGAALLSPKFMCCEAGTDTETEVETETDVAESENLVFPGAAVAISQSDKEQAVDLSYQDIKDLISDAVELAGGLGSIIKDGYTVV